MPIAPIREDWGVNFIVIGLREEAFLLQVLGMFQSACGYSDY
jgi:hypothetical protein